MKKLIFPIVLTLLFIIEGLVVAIWNSNLYGNGHIIVPHFLLFALIFYAIYNNSNVAVYYSIIFGFLFDVTYTEVLGVYTFGFPVIVYLTYQVSRILQNHLLIVTFLSMVSIAIMEYYVYFLYILVNVTNMTHSVFLHSRLLPTLLLNGVFVIVFGFVLQRIFLYLHKKEEE